MDVVYFLRSIGKKLKTSAYIRWNRARKWAEDLKKKKNSRGGNFVKNFWVNNETILDFGFRIM